MLVRFIIELTDIATRGAQLVPIGIPTICLYNFKPNPKDNGEHHTFSDMATIYII